MLEPLLLFIVDCIASNETTIIGEREDNHRRTRRQLSENETTTIGEREDNHRITIWGADFCDVEYKLLF